MHFVGSLPPSDHPDLVGVAKRRYRVVDAERFPGLRAFETEKVVFAERRRLVVCHSETLHAKQSAGFDQTLAKACRHLGEIRDRLGRGKTRKAKADVEAEIDTILGPRWVTRVVSTTLMGESPAELRLSFTVNAEARADLKTSSSASASSSPTRPPRRPQPRRPSPTTAPKRPSRPTSAR